MNRGEESYQQTPEKRAKDSTHRVMQKDGRFPSSGKETAGAQK